MIRYNAAHRGAENDIFPRCAVRKSGDHQLYRHEVDVPAPPSERVARRGPDPYGGECYRFVLSNPSVHVALTAPKNERELDENLDALEQGPLPEEDDRFMRTFGDAVHHTKKWFM